MSRRMSCSLTIDAVRARTKKVTRRHVDTWRTLKPGDRLTLIEKGMGLAKGERQVVLADVEIVAVMVGDIGFMSPMDCFHEGLPWLSPAEFVDFWLRSHGYKPDQLADPGGVKCRRIVWRYDEEAFARRLAAEVYTPEGVEIWMTARHVNFGGRSPLDLIAMGETEPVLQRLEQLVAGAFA